MRISSCLLVLAVGLHCEVATAHRDRLITIEDDGSLSGLPVEYGPAKLQVAFATAATQPDWTPAVSSVVLTLGENRSELPECLIRILNSKSLNDLAISASWYHTEEHLPYYLNVMFLDPGYAIRDEAPGFRLLFNLRTAKLIRLEVMIFEHEGTVGRDLPVDVKILCPRSQDLTPTVNRMWPNYALERSVKVLAKGAAGAWESLAPAAPTTGVPRPAQRGR